MSERNAYIKALEYYLPEKVVTNEELCKVFPDWTPEKIYKKTGIKSRHVTADGETALDLAEKACIKLFEKNPEMCETIDFIILMTQSPDYKLPPSACILQDRLRLNKAIGAFDINLGCSAYEYGLMVAKSLVVSETAKNVLLVTSETYSKYINERDKSTRTLFGDGATATLVSAEGPWKIGKSDFGTDGSGYDKLIVPAGMSRLPSSGETAEEHEDENGYIRSRDNLFMDGTEIFNFSLDVVPVTVNRLIEKYCVTKDEVDFFVFHQANGFMLSHLRRMCHIPKEKFYINLEETGNTVSSSVPIALKMAEEAGLLLDKRKIMLVGFGVGLSWASTMLDAEE